MVNEMKSRSLVVMTILAFLLATTMVTVTTSLATMEKQSIDWRIEMIEDGEYDINFQLRGENIFWQTHKHNGIIYEGDTEIGTVIMQIFMVVDMTSGKGHANVKFDMSTNYGEITGVINGKLKQVMVDEELFQYVDGRFVGNGDIHIQGTVTDVEAKPEEIELIGYKW